MNTQTTTRIEVAETAVRGDGPGGQLRQARLDLKLQPEDVAHILHLSPRQIVALESDDYEHLPGPTYVRGYLRGYAQLLGLSAEPVVETYNRLVTAKKPVDLGKLAPKAEIRSDHQLIKFATVGVIAIVVGLSAVWWREQERPVPPVISPEPSDQTSGNNEPGASDTASVVVESEEPRTSVTIPSVAAPPVAHVAPAKSPVPATEPAPKQTPTVTSTAPAAVSPATPVATPGPRGRLVLQAQLDSWVDVRDATGNRLLYETIPAGHTVTIEGATPLSVFLGNVDGMRVEFNGEPYDASRYKRGEIARFTLGEAARGQ